MSLRKIVELYSINIYQYHEINILFHISTFLKKHLQTCI